MNVRFLALCVAAFSLSCGVAASVDPRCVTFCKVSENEYTNATLGPSCSEKSTNECLRACNVHIEELSTLCQSCLLEKPGKQGLLADGYLFEKTCDLPILGDTCTVKGPGGSCTYLAQSDAERVACYEKTFPKEEVACSTVFRATGECATQCANP
jgi:hypothetical protein